MNRLFTVAVCAATLGITGCPPDTDVGKDCALVKALPDGGAGDVLRSDITDPSRDIISFGALDCEDLICVRAGNSTLPESSTAPVFGKCSRACVAGQSCPAYDPALDKNPATAFTCRSLLLDEATLRALQNDPEAGVYFRDRNTQYFCAQAIADAGT